MTAGKTLLGKPASGTRRLVQRFGEHGFEGDKITVLLEQPQSSIDAIEHMVRVTTHNGSSTARHSAQS